MGPTLRVCLPVVIYVAVAVVSFFGGGGGVQVCWLPSNNPAYEETVSEFGLYCKSTTCEGLPRGVVLGEYTGTLRHLRSRGGRCPCPSACSTCASAALLGPGELRFLEDVENELGVSAIDKSRFKFDVSLRDGTRLVIDSRRYRSHLAYVNDPSDFKSGKHRKANAVFEVDNNLGGWTHVFLRTTAPIAPGEEVLAEYGETYWKVLKKLTGAA